MDCRILFIKNQYFMGKTYRRDSDRKFKNFQRDKNKVNKLKHQFDKPKRKRPCGENGINDAELVNDY